MSVKRFPFTLLNSRYKNNSIIISKPFFEKHHLFELELLKKKKKYYLALANFVLQLQWWLTQMIVHLQHKLRILTYLNSDMKLKDIAFK